MIKITLHFTCDSPGEAEALVEAARRASVPTPSLPSSPEAIQHYLDQGHAAKQEKREEKQTRRQRAQQAEDPPETNEEGGEEDAEETGEDNEDAAPAKATGAPNRKNVSPGDPAIGKIGVKARVDILNALKRNAQPKPARLEHAKLLWQRGVVKYDGKVFYL